MNLKKIFLILLFIIIPVFAIFAPSTVDPDVLVRSNDTIKVAWGSGGNPFGTIYQLHVTFDDDFGSASGYIEETEELEYTLNTNPNTKRCFRVRARDPFSNELSTWTYINNGNCLVTFSNSPTNIGLEPDQESICNPTDLTCNSGTAFCFINDTSEPMRCLSKTYNFFVDAVSNESSDGKCGIHDGSIYRCNLNQVCDISQDGGTCVDANQVTSCSYTKCNSALGLRSNVPHSAACSSVTKQFYKVDLNDRCKLSWKLVPVVNPTFRLGATFDPNVCGASTCNVDTLTNVQTCNSPGKIEPGTYYAYVERTSTDSLAAAYDLIPVVTECD